MEHSHLDAELEKDECASSADTSLTSPCSSETSPSSVQQQDQSNDTENPSSDAIADDSTPGATNTGKPTPKQKRLQAQKACSNCKRLHARCDNERPCKRCIQNGLANTCIDLPRKRRMSRSYTEAVNKVWEARYGTNTKVTPTPVTMPVNTAWNVPLPVSYSPQVYPMQTPSPTLSTPHPIQTPAFPTSSMYMTEIVNPAVEPMVAPSPPVLLEKQDPIMESFLYHQMTELRENVAQNDRYYDIENIRERAFKPVWHSFAPQDFAISVWKATNTPGFNYLIECNERFVDLVGFPIEQLRNSFSGQKLFISKTLFSQKDWPKRTQIATAYGFKEVFITLYPMFADVASNKYFILHMIEVPPARESVSVSVVPDVMYSPELMKQNLDMPPTYQIHYKM